MKAIRSNVEADAAGLCATFASDVSLSIDRKRDHLVLTEVQLTYKAGVLVKRKNVVVARYKLRPVKLLEREGK